MGTASGGVQSSLLLKAVSAPSSERDFVHSRRKPPKANDLPVPGPLLRGLTCPPREKPLLWVRSQPLLLQFTTSWLAQPPFVWQVLHPPQRLGSPPLNSQFYLCLSCAGGVQKSVRCVSGASQKSRVGGRSRFSRSGRAPAAGARHAVSLHRCQGALLTHV